MDLVALDDRGDDVHAPLLGHAVDKVKRGTAVSGLRKLAPGKLFAGAHKEWAVPGLLEAKDLKKRKKKKKKKKKLKKIFKKNWSCEKKKKKKWRTLEKKKKKKHI